MSPGGERIRFYLDEHVPRAVAEGLRRRGVDVVTAQEVGRAGAPDEGHLALATQEIRVIVTQDADFLRLHASGHSHAGIVYAPQRTSVGAMVSSLMLIHEVLASHDMIGHVEFV